MEVTLVVPRKQVVTVSHLKTATLDKLNFYVWKVQFGAILRSHELMDYVEGKGDVLAQLEVEKISLFSDGRCLPCPCLYFYMLLLARRPMRYGLHYKGSLYLTPKHGFYIWDRNCKPWGRVNGRLMSTSVTLPSSWKTSPWLEIQRQTGMSFSTCSSVLGRNTNLLFIKRFYSNNKVSIQFNSQWMKVVDN